MPDTTSFTFPATDPRHALELLAADTKINPHFRLGLNRELAEIRHHAQEADRTRGCGWAGMGPDAFKARSMEQIEADARRRADEMEAFRASPRGRFLKAIISLASCGDEEAEACRAIYSRSFADDRQELNTEAVGRVIRILAPKNHSDARAAVQALGDLLAGGALAMAAE